MNPQMSAAIRNLLIAGGGALATKYGLDNNLVPMVAGLAMSGFGALWSAYGHLQGSVIAEASALPEVHAVVTSNRLADSVKFIGDAKVIRVDQAKAIE